MYNTAAASLSHFLRYGRLSDRHFTVKLAKMDLLLFWDIIPRSSEWHICPIFAPLDNLFLALLWRWQSYSQTSAFPPWQTFTRFRFEGNDRWLCSKIAIALTSLIPNVSKFGPNYIVHSAVPETCCLTVYRRSRKVAGKLAKCCLEVAIGTFFSHHSQIAIASSSVIPEFLKFGFSYITSTTVPETSC